MRYSVEALGIERIETKSTVPHAQRQLAEAQRLHLEGTLRQARMHGGRALGTSRVSALEPEIRDALAGDGFTPMGFWSSPGGHAQR